MEGPGDFDKSGGDEGPIGRGLEETHVKRRGQVCWQRDSPCSCQRGAQLRCRPCPHPAPSTVECKAVLIFALTCWQVLLFLAVRVPSVHFHQRCFSTATTADPTADLTRPQQCSCQFPSTSPQPFPILFLLFLFIKFPATSSYF